MFSLIITIISIALVAALALATLYYGGAAFNKGSAEAEASKILLQGQQLLGAADLYFADHNTWPTLQQLQDGNYLKSVPAAGLAVSDAHAATAWTMPIAGQPVFLLASTTPGETCAAVNQKGSLGKRGILRQAYTQLNAQCFGASGSYKVVFKKFGTSTSLLDNADGLVDLAPSEVNVGTVPTDPGDSAWSMSPSLSTGGAGGGGAGGGDTGGGGSADPVPSGFSVPASLSFAEIARGQSSRQALVVTNNSTSPATVTSVTSSNPSFSASLGDCASELAPQATCTVQVDFAPSAVGQADGTLTVTSVWTGGEFELDVSLTGLARELQQTYWVTATGGKWQVGAWTATQDADQSLSCKRFRDNYRPSYPHFAAIGSTCYLGWAPPSPSSFGEANTMYYTADGTSGGYAATEALTMQDACIVYNHAAVSGVHAVFNSVNNYCELYDGSGNYLQGGRVEAYRLN